MVLEKGKKANKELTVKTEDLGERRVLFVISKEVTDRDGDILRASGVDLTNYMKNPVFLPFHNTRDFPLGKTEKVWVEGTEVKAIVYFPTVEELSTDPSQASEKARICDFAYNCYKTGMLNAVSVGFIPLEYKWITNDQGEVTGWDVLKWELLEFSAVAVPANQDAIAEAVKSFGEDFAKDFVSNRVEKSGRRISASTKETLDKIKACGDRIEKIREEMREVTEEMIALLAELDDSPEEPEEPEEDDKSFDLNEITTDFDLSDL